MRTILCGVTVAAALALGVTAQAPAATGTLFGDAAIVPGGAPGFAAQIRSDTSGPGFGGVSFAPSAPISWASLSTLSADYNVTDDGCGGGSPRFVLGVDTDGDGVRNGVVQIAIGASPSFTGCAAGWQASGNVIGNEDAGRYDYSAFGGSPFTTYSGAPASVLAGQVVTASVVVDGSWSADASAGDGEQTVLVDNIDLDGALVTFDCSFTQDAVAQAMTLDGDCSTDHTILVPEGFTLDGDGHTITAVDPAGSHFVGAVVMNEGGVANVTNLTVTASGLADVCDAGDDRLRGILLDGASGSLTGNTVTGLRQGSTSGCQEGTGIEVRNFGPGGTVEVTIDGNEVTAYQKNGITVGGDVTATISDNVVTGDGPVDYIAQNGVQVGFGAAAEIAGNTISGNDYTPKSFTAAGILLFGADSSTNGQLKRQNELFDNEADIVRFGSENASSVDG